MASRVNLESDIKRWTTECYPEVFTVIPTNKPKEKVGQLTQAQLEHYFKHGYVIVENLLDPSDLEPVKHGIEDLVEELAQKLYKAGKIKNLHREQDLFHRLTKLEEEFPGANILLHKRDSIPEVLKQIWTNEKLLNIAEQLLGTSDIGGNPVWNLRTKTPACEAVTVPWHQDAGYLSSDGHKVHHPTAWIPLIDTNKQNGCMEMIKDGHKQGKMVHHHGLWRDTWYLEIGEEDLTKSLGVNMSKDVVTCPVPYGGALLFSNIIPHRSLDNLSDKIRWSIDLRWQRMCDTPAFYGLKDAIRFRSSTDPNYKPDWAGFDTVSVKEDLTADTREDFDTTIGGPWFDKWGTRHTNRHYDAWEKEKASSKTAQGTMIY